MLKKALLMAVCTAAGLYAGVAVAAPAGAFSELLGASSAAPLHEQRPLVVIRFNQRNVYYQRPLYSAVVRALQVKPTVMFDVVSVVPVTGDAAADKKNADTSMINVRSVFKDMVDMGIPDNRIKVSREDSSTVDTNEVHVFVR